MVKLLLILVASCVAIAVIAVRGTVASGPLFLAALLITLSVGYVHISGGVRPGRLFDLPVLVTARLVVSFAIVPIQAILMPDKLNARLQGDSNLAMQALSFVILGMVCFWAGCGGVKSCAKSTIVIEGRRTSFRLMFAVVAVYAVGFGCNLYLLQHQLFAYTASLTFYRDNLASAQWPMFGATFADLGLVLISIERFSNPSNRMVRWLFRGILLSQCAWGLLSGMKESLLIDILAIAAVATVSKRKLATGWLVFAVLGLVLLYPFYNSYRAVVRGVGSSQITTLSGGFGALVQAAKTFDDGMTYGDWIGSGTDLSMSRLDLLQCFELLISLPNHAEEIQGEERLWMVPIYPFVPRIIWPTKPILDKGARFTRALGGGMDSSTAVPYLADCYTFGGVIGVAAGMFALGLFVRGFTRYLKASASKRDLFRYLVALLLCFKIEEGVLVWWPMVIKTMIFAYAIERIVYGFSPSRKALALKHPVILRGTGTLSHNAGPVLRSQQHSCRSHG